MLPSSCFILGMQLKKLKCLWEFFFKISFHVKLTLEKKNQDGGTAKIKYKKENNTLY